MILTKVSGNDRIFFGGKGWFAFIDKLRTIIRTRHGRNTLKLLQPPPEVKAGANVGTKELPT